MWPADIVDVSTTASPNGGLRIALDSAGAVTLVWSEGLDRSDGIYGESLRLDGTLGGPSTLVRRRLLRR